MIVAAVPAFFLVPPPPRLLEFHRVRVGGVARRMKNAAQAGVFSWEGVTTCGSDISLLMVSGRRRVASTLFWRV